MDPLSYFLAFARLAPVQLAFWGHPDSAALPAIDYFVGLDADADGGRGGRGGSAPPPPPLSRAAPAPSAHEWYAEQYVRLRGLGVRWARDDGEGGDGPDARAERAAALANRTALRAELWSYLRLGAAPPDAAGGGGAAAAAAEPGPPPARVAVCAQALFKWHPAFVRALAALLVAEPSLVVVAVLPAEPLARDAWRRELDARLRAALRDAGGGGGDDAAAGGDAAARLRWLPRLSARPLRRLLVAADAVRSLSALLRIVARARASRAGR